MEEVSTLDDRQDKLTQPISTHKQTLRLTEEGSILKSVLVGKREKTNLHMHLSDQGPTLNQKTHVECFALLCSKYISYCHYPSQFQQVNEYRPTETKVLEALISILKILT